MKKSQKVAGIFLSLLLILSAVIHIINPDFSSGFIPDFLPKYLVHVVVAIIEFVLGVGVFIPKYRKLALQGIFLLMIAFIPVHIGDLFSENPVVKPFIAALIRVPVQFLLVYLAWYAGGKFNSK